MNDPTNQAAPHRKNAAGMIAQLSAFQRSSILKGVWQLANSLIPYLALWWLAIICLPVSYWLVIPIAVLASGFLVRIFIIFHDCCHGSFFKSSRANHVLGAITGVLTFTPYYHWRWQHGHIAGEPTVVGALCSR